MNSAGVRGISVREKIIALKAIHCFSFLVYEDWLYYVLKGRLLKAVERTLSCDSASNSKVEKRVKDTSDSSVAQKNVILSGKELFFIFRKTLFIKNEKS